MLFQKIGLSIKSTFVAIFTILLMSGICFANQEALQVDFLASGVLKSNGQPNAYGTVVFKDTASSAYKDVYSSSAKTAVLSQPIRLDIKGRAKVYADGAYNITVYDKAGVVVDTFDSFSYEKLTNAESIEIDVLADYGSSTTQLKNLIDSLSTSNYYTLAFKEGTYILSESIIFPENCVLHFYNGAVWQIAADIEPVINGHIEAGQYRIFTGSGTVDIDSVSNPFQYPYWSGNDLGQADFSKIYLERILAPSPNGMLFEQDGNFAKDLFISGNLTVYGTINATISGTSSESVYSQDSDKLDGQHGAFYQDADNLDAGRVPDARLAGTYLATSANALTLLASQHTSTLSQHAATINTLSYSKVPYTGATGNVSLGSYGLTALTLTSTTLNAGSGKSLNFKPGTYDGSTYGRINFYNSNSNILAIFGESTFGYSQESAFYGEHNLYNADNALMVKFGNRVVPSSKDVTFYGGIIGTLSTASQPNITAVGSLVSLTVAGHQTITGNLGVTGNVAVSGNTVITGTTRLVGNTTIEGSLGVTTNLYVSGNQTNSGTMNVIGDINSVATTTWNPVLSAGSGDTVPVYSVIRAICKKVGKLVYFWIYLSGDGGTEGLGTTDTIRIATPYPPSSLYMVADYNVIGNGIYTNGTTHNVLAVEVVPAGYIISEKPDGTGFLCGDQNNTNRTYKLYGVYETN